MGELPNGDVYTCDNNADSRNIFRHNVKQYQYRGYDYRRTFNGIILHLSMLKMQIEPFVKYKKRPVKNASVVLIEQFFR